MHLISIDWLTISVDCTNFAVNTNYSCVREPYGTSVFQEMYTISMDGLQLAILTKTPRMKHMDAHLGLIKILNPILYLPNLDRIVYNLLFDFRLAIKGISRLDLCADFHRFNDYPDPQTFIRDFLAVNIWKIGQAKYKVAGKVAQSVKHTARQRRAAKKAHVEQESFKVIGKQSARHNYQYLRFGSNVSDVSAYLYNKTQEFIDVKRKNYIVEMWDTNGLDSSQTVWRLEFSLKGNGIKFIDTTSGEFKQKTLDMCLDPVLREQLFNACFLRYWVFRYNDGQVRKDRMKPCNLLDIESSIYIPRVIQCSDETTRENKRMITAMEKTYDEIRIKHQVRDMEIETALDKFTDFVKLNSWRAEHYGKKYTDMDLAEEIKRQEEMHQLHSPSPTLFEN